jgi:hypothetical protein
MDLSKVLAISGKPGLYKMLAQTKNGMVVESINDGKRFTAFAHEQISTLEEISIYTENEDMPLKEVFKAMYDKLDGKAAISHKSDSEKLKSFFEEAVPSYDKENVYVSDIKKVINWYNTLLENKMMEFKEEESASVESAEENSSAEASEEKPSSAETSESKEEN